MSAGGLEIRRKAPERLAAWLVTGPLGHLAAFLADAAGLWLAWASGEARRRVRRARGGLGGGGAVSARAPREGPS